MLVPKAHQTWLVMDLIHLKMSAPDLVLAAFHQTFFRPWRWPLSLIAHDKLVLHNKSLHCTIQVYIVMLVLQLNENTLTKCQGSAWLLMLGKFSFIIARTVEDLFKFTSISHMFSLTCQWPGAGWPAHRQSETSGRPLGQQAPCCHFHPTPRRGLFV